MLTFESDIGLASAPVKDLQWDLSGLLTGTGNARNRMNTFENLTTNYCSFVQAGTEEKDVRAHSHILKASLNPSYESPVHFSGLQDKYLHIRNITRMSARERQIVIRVTAGGWAPVSATTTVRGP